MYTGIRKSSRFPSTPISLEGVHPQYLSTAVPVGMYGSCDTLLQLKWVAMSVNIGSVRSHLLTKSLVAQGIKCFTRFPFVDTDQSLLPCSNNYLQGKLIVNRIPLLAHKSDGLTGISLALA